MTLKKEEEMDDLFWILVFGAAIVFFFWKMKREEKEWESRRNLGFPKEVPVNDDCIEASRKMVDFISSRLHDINGRPMEEFKVGEDNFYQKFRYSHDLVDFVRLAHLAGCHIKIEQVPGKDTETPEETVEKGKVFCTDLRVAKSVRCERKFSS